MATREFTSWGGQSAFVSHVVSPASAASAALPATPFLAVGAGRSYGDTGLPVAVAVDTSSMRRILSFDARAGVLRAESGILLAEIIDAIVPHGWFLPVTPGTRHVTLGGAVANDVHGKNHHRGGTFGCHVRAFELLRSNGVRLVCSPSKNADYFVATIGGMGLTGLVTWVEIELMKTGSPHVAQTATRFANLREYFAVHAESDADFEYSVAWIDSLASGAHLGRGVSMLGNHARPEDLPPPAPGDAMRAARIGVPFRLPFAAVSGPALRAFNAAYFRKPLGRAGATVDYKSFFYPLDGVNGWNRLYGPRGLRQFQCVVPEANAEAAIGDMLRLAQHAGQGSFLTVLKKFGVTLSPGLLSFPRPGFTLTLDFPYRGPVTDRLLGDLDAIALAAGGGVNPYKDARMSREVFEASFPRWRQMQAAIDPLAQSQFSQRIGLTGVAHPAIYAAA